MLLASLGIAVVCAPVALGQDVDTAGPVVAAAPEPPPVLAALPDEPAVVVAEPVAGADEPVTAADQPPAGTDDPPSAADDPVVGTDDPRVGADAPPPGTDDLAVGADAPPSGADDPMVGADAPAVVADQPAPSAPRAVRPAQEQPPPAPTTEPDAPGPAPLPADDPGCVFPQPETDIAASCTLLASQCDLLGTPGDDLLVGGATADLVCGLGGDDVLDGGGGNDVLLGGDGDDQLTGGDGTDCLLGQAGEDAFPGVDADGDELVAAGEDLFVQDGESGPGIEGQIGFLVVTIEDGRCLAILVAGQPTPVPPTPSYGSGGPDVSVETAGIVYRLAQVLEQTEQGGRTGTVPVELDPEARARDGVARLLLRCPDVTVTGTLELFERRGGDEIPVGRADFTCEPSSEVVEVELSERAQDRLAQRGRLTLTVRIAADGAETEAKLRIEPA